jgi:hypothetical protein
MIGHAGLQNCYKHFIRMYVLTERNIKDGVDFWRWVSSSFSIHQYVLTMGICGDVTSAYTGSWYIFA